MFQEIGGRDHTLAHRPPPPGGGSLSTFKKLVSSSIVKEECFAVDSLDPKLKARWQTIIVVAAEGRKTPGGHVMEVEWVSLLGGVAFVMGAHHDLVVGRVTQMTGL